MHWLYFPADNVTVSLLYRHSDNLVNNRTMEFPAGTVDCALNVLKTAISLLSATLGSLCVTQVWERY